MRPIRVSHAVRHHARRMHPGPPRAAAGTGPPCERRVLVRKARIHAQRILHLRMDELAALVQRAEFFAESIDGFARGKRHRRGPESAALHAPERRQARPAAKVLVGDRREQRRALPQQPESQRRAGDLEHRVVGRDRPPARRRFRDGARLGAADDQSIVRTRVGAEAQPERAVAVGRDFEEVAGGCREGNAGRRRAQALQCFQAQVGSRVEKHRGVGARGVSRRIEVRAVPGYRRRARRCRRIAAGGRARPLRASAARW